MKTRKEMAALLLGAVALLHPSDALAQGNPTEWLKQSSIVVVGTVTEVGGASFAAVPQSDRTLVVRVDSVLRKPEAVALNSGDQMTIMVKDPSQFRKGVQATFYAEGWIFGEGLAVREVGHEISPAALSPEAISQNQKKLEDMQREIEDAELRRRIQEADVVVVGKVVTVRPASMPSLAPSRTPISEHEANWQEAVVRVESGIKGAEANQQIVLRFPGSLDVAWYGMPKFKEGQEGTFLLKTDQVSGATKAMLAGAQVPAYTSLSTKDVLPKSEAERVRTLAEQ